MAKFTLQPNPTFKAKVKIPVPGADKEPEVEFIFKFRDRDELAALLERAKDQELIKTVMDMTAGWDLSDEFNADNVGLLDRTYIGALGRVIEAYWNQHTKALEKN